MSSLFITSAIRDLIPTHPEPYPGELVNFAHSLYTASKMNVPLSGSDEIARYHLACYTVVEYFKDSYSLPDPFLTKIPIPSKRFNQLLFAFKTTMTTITQNTPKAKRIVDVQLQTPSTTPFSSKSTESYIDKIRQSKLKQQDLQQQQVNRSLTNQLLEVAATPPSTPQKAPRSKRTQLSPSKLSPYKARPKLVITTPILVSFCNKFYIPEHITMHILQTFKLYKHVVPNGWGLLVGLVGISYMKLNKQRISKKLNLKTKLFKLLHVTQQGGLSYDECKQYIREVTRMICTQKWIKEAKYDFDTDTETESLMKGIAASDSVMSSLGSFLDSSVLYVTMKDSPKVQKWVKSIRRTTPSTPARSPAPATI
ncbi:Origin recognition complex subunit 6 [Pichia kudriavzevii]|uniref:Origin recognition complex subunit 6 n=1 Tax=Pichia kudriavzevii TaxID=4909 RepID=A0A1V2LUY9_PICKU|nr:Origin recognition complex subunit 6 [Pichia kudriavzevii]